MVCLNHADTISRYLLAVMFSRRSLCGNDEHWRGRTHIVYWGIVQN